MGSGSAFYGMQGILLIYLYYPRRRAALGISEATATQIVGAYGGGAHLATIVGAWLADRARPGATLYAAVVVMWLPHRAVRAAGIDRRHGRADPDVRWQRRRQGQRELAGRLRSTPRTTSAATAGSRCSTWHQPGAFAGPLLTGLLQEGLGLPRRVRPRRGRHGGSVPCSTPGRRRLPDATRVALHPLELASAFGTPASRSSHSGVPFAVPW